MISCMLFDLDGTIVNTNELILSSFRYALETHRLPLPTREEMIPHMGTTLKHQLTAFTGRTEVQELEEAYRSYQNEHHDRLIQAFPGVDKTLEELHRRGVKLGVVTTKIRPTTIRALDMFDLAKYMETIVTVNEVTHPKPHPEPVLTALRQLGAAPGKTLMVGDSPADIQSAKAAGVLSAGVAWSLKGPETLRRYEPDYIIEEMGELLALAAGGRGSQ
ncbi:pyrophosphatase PpaX [Paenibacillus spiritus]|uniref:Pyrophosphatase PpaX n=1 Tax=Paenibacillus spiritus TaxID=2496557 RepID=A0A5J5G507_9BACL|nr:MULTISPECIES: pyrophosphatase PpaX [Paenibacillus]KAA9002346.1 pyrophosphatase PpaX [Paenibacillus spiritus]